MSIAGLHHLAATCSQARRSLDFYGNVLGLRPLSGADSAPFYCGNALGSPGSLIALGVQHDTRRDRGRDHGGTGQVGAATLAVPPGSLGYWRARLAGHGVTLRGRAWSFGEEHLCFTDPDRLDLALVEDVGPGGAGSSWDGASVPPRHAIRRWRSIEVLLDIPGPMAAFLVEALGFRATGRDGAAMRLRNGPPDMSFAVDLVSAPDDRPGARGPGMVEHVAWRVADDHALAALRARLLARGIAVEPPLDRHRFRAARFEAPGGIGFMLATDGPGFAVRPD